MTTKKQLRQEIEAQLGECQAQRSRAWTEAGDSEKRALLMAWPWSIHCPLGQLKNRKIKEKINKMERE